jgi:hypothetical protein
VIDREEHGVRRRLARRDLQRHPGADAVCACFVRRRRHDGSLGRIAAPADDHGPARELRVTQHLDGGDELVHVDMQHPRAGTHESSVAAPAPVVTCALLTARGGRPSRASPRRRSRRSDCPRGPRG